ncbi:sigma-70 family RNA polymerase sigma factor [Halobacillus sp. A5]|uniref:sigma-70 family RNA polymerase sigma factor n=1 Tax=Halobacillus sp. A5 TaxID=2880263 RepID=UPI0020A69279|nr:sigma-70 family RNA polymerase sigma factor [Halobacillus sp. A5]MCP3028057.1 sigma-70 family RNA polymerase sigma factor [Halobacillus sp. A5]
MYVNDQEFERIVLENERLIHYHIHSLHIKDANGDFFAIGLEALWKAYESYDPSVGKFSTYLSWKVRNALIDEIRRDSKRLKNQNLLLQMQSSLSCLTSEDVIIDQYLWDKIKTELTLNQWKWVYYFIIHDLSVSQIADIEGVTSDAVKNWGRHARKKLRKVLIKQTTLQL